MALYFLNLSIDPVDRMPDHISEDTSVNDIESVIELVCEEVLGIVNSIPESDESDGNKESGPKSFDLTYCTITNVPASLAVPFFAVEKNEPFHTCQFFSSPLRAVHCPPPQQG